MQNPLAAPYFAPLLQAIAAGATGAASAAGTAGATGTAGQQKIKIHGLWGSAEALLLSHLAAEGHPFCVITPSAHQAERLFQELRLFFALQATPSILTLSLFPAWDVLPFEPTRPRPDQIGERLSLLHQLARGGRVPQGEPHCVVTSIEAFLQRVISKSALLSKSFPLYKDLSLDKETLLLQCAAAGYEPCDLVTQPGEISHRGGIVDLYPPPLQGPPPSQGPRPSEGPQPSHGLHPSQGPVRIEFFGDRIESIRRFDPNSQRSIRSDYPPDSDYPPRSGRTPSSMEEIEIIPGREDLSDPEFYSTPFSEYLPAGMVLVLDEPDEILLKGKRFLETAQEGALFATQGKSSQPSQGPQPSHGSQPSRKRSSPRFEALYLPLTHIAEAGTGRMTLEMESLSISLNRGSKRFVFDGLALSSLKLGSPGQPFSEVAELLTLLRRDHLLTVVTTSEQQRTRFQHLFSEYQLPWMPLEEKIEMAFPAPILLVVGTLSEGFVLPQMKVVFIPEEALLGRASRRHLHKASQGSQGSRGSHPSQGSDPSQGSHPSRGIAFLSSISEIKPNDYVVHFDHGIGRYIGLKRLTLRTQEWRGEKIEADFLVLEYLGGDKVYVPIDSLNQVSRYLGGEGVAPKIDKLGGAHWNNTKTRVRGRVKEMTGELLKLYSERAVAEGYPFAAPPPLTEAFAATFEYEETPDQLRAIEETLLDMERPRPMDRLIVGDVGFGKTEVAMRAAFHAVMDNKQVAILVPTTLLAQQHYQTFSKRFSAFPVRVDVLSRFRTHSEQKGILTDAHNGKVDILIGTHRILNKDLVFRDLGLVIIDEEHHFGVSHKEKFKQIRTKVDVLTLTATPIPRTLQMAMAQVRDLSTIETPPTDRLAIHTVLSAFNPTIIREAIFRELVRDGQVFFIHNRVHNIEQVGAFLAELVPEAKIAIAHGQMREAVLEAIMLKFIAKEYNVLVTTTIIESGLDIPSANTIFINNADHFGLAELYQLRGRVGRSSEQAYAYLLVKEERDFSEAALKRLQAIQEFSALGSGFKIAGRDMEIRGAGNLLGAEQSGQIQAIGFDLYLKMIDEAVRELKGTQTETSVEPTLSLSVSAYLPESYIPDTHQRLSLYKRLIDCTDPEALASIRMEMADRYGPIPPEGSHLLQTVEVRQGARAVRAVQVAQHDLTLAFTFDPAAPPSDRGLSKLIDTYKKRIHFPSPWAFSIDLKEASWEETFLEIGRCLVILKTK